VSSTAEDGGTVAERCRRLPWDFWPFGGTDVRLHAYLHDMDIFTSGVPAGYESLLDGTLIAQRFADTAKEAEQARLETNVRQAERVLARLAAPAQGEGAVWRIRRDAILMMSLEDMLRPDLPGRDGDVAKRSVIGFREVWKEPLEDVVVE